MENIFKLYDEFFAQFKPYLNGDVCLLFPYRFILVTYEKENITHKASVLLGYFDAKADNICRLQVISQVEYTDDRELDIQAVAYILLTLLRKTVFVEGFKFFAKMNLQFGGDEDDYLYNLCFSIPATELERYTLFYSYTFQPEG
jgi:hypothetical protein